MEFMVQQRQSNLSWGSVRTAEVSKPSDAIAEAGFTEAGIYRIRAEGDSVTEQLYRLDPSGVAVAIDAA